MQLVHSTGGLRCRACDFAHSNGNLTHSCKFGVHAVNTGYKWDFDLNQIPLGPSFDGGGR